MSSSEFITVSGSSVPMNGISWPSGLFGSGVPGHDLCAFLASLNATFGFNLNPHTFQMEWIPCGDANEFHGASGQLPNIGSNFELYIGDFYLRGYVTHADYTSSKDGTIINVNIEDNRKTLQQVKIHTEDLGENVPSGIVSVARAYRKINGLYDIDGSPSDPLVKEYLRILEIGATYSQILSAIDYTYNEGKLSFPVSEFPTKLKLQANIGPDIDNIRWQFNLSSADEVMSRILVDTGFDWYWNMASNQLNLINKKNIFDVTENGILDYVSSFGSASGLNETLQIGFGHDIIQEPTRFRVLGGHQEGVLNSEILSPIDGLDSSELDGRIIFRKAWDQLTIGFYDADGFYRTYIPKERELQLALLGIEQWSYFKKYQNTSTGSYPVGFGLASDAGSIAAQDGSFQSRLDPLMPLAGEATSAGQSGIRIISNRRDAEHNWTLDFYNRVKSHATRHYGRTYIASGVLFNNASGLFRLVDAAWANIENQIQGGTLSASGSVGGLFTEDYEINRSLGPVSPFITDDFRVTAHCVLPANTVYGPLGEDTPASFANWTEDAAPFNPSGDGRHYIPVELTVVGQRVIDPRSDNLYAFERYSEGTLLCQLPINAGPDYGLVNDNIIQNLETLVSVNDRLTGSGVLDIVDPSVVLNVYDELSGVVIPVESRSRYGQSYPTTWVSGTLNSRTHEDVQLDDQFVPWAFSPQGNKTSLDIMTDRAMSRVIGKVINSDTSRYADFTQIGLPLLSFDSFANQQSNSDGLYGAITHGVNELNIGFSNQGFMTRYKIQSYFPKFGKDAPLGERVRGLLNGIINPIDFTFLKLGNQTPPASNNPFIPADAKELPFFTTREERAVRVTITEVNDIFTLSSSNNTGERYRGIDRHGYTKPYRNVSSSDIDQKRGALCIDGFLNIDDSAIYHTDQFELPGGTTIFRYFTGGRPFGNGTIVTVEQASVTTPGTYDVTIFDSNGMDRAILGVPVLNGSVNIGDRTVLSVRGDGDVTPGFNAGGVYIQGTSFGAGVVPAEIISVSNQGTTSATAICQELNSNGSLATGGETYSGVIPLPYRQFATSGDRGFLASAIVPDASTGSGVTTNFIEIVKPAFIRYN